MLKRLLRICPFIFCLFSLIVFADPVYFKQFTFDDDNDLLKWKKMILNREVDYLLRWYGAQGFVQASSNGACSALYRRVKYRLTDYPLISWKWKVEQFPDIGEKGTEAEKDDFAARFYVIFSSWSFSSSKFLEYVWAKDLEVGTVLGSKSGENVKRIVIRNSSSESETWLAEVRNVYEDYKFAFGQEPPKKVGAVAIMCDADGTNSTAESLFDDIQIERLAEK